MGAREAAEYGCQDIHTAAESDRVSAFFRALERHIALPRRDCDAMLDDFARALRFYLSAGIPLDEALSRLDAANLGGFYARPARLWFALDDAAKVYPLAMRHGYMAVFRLSVYLREPVVPEILQVALSFTIKRFPSFATTVKKGFFWHYLDATKRRYAVEQETGAPCRPIRISGSGSQSFRVLFYGRRISVEYFHILTDGTGGMVFLKTLTAEYFRLLGVGARPGFGILGVNDPVRAGETENAFTRADRAGGASGFVDRPAAQFGGKLAARLPCRVLHYKLDAARLKALAKGKNATVTAYLLALMFVAGRWATDETGGEFSIQVPVNMRKYYPSETVRNFAMYCGIRLPVSAVTGVDDILPEIVSQLEQKTSRAAMGEMMNATERLVGLVRWVPLFVKAPAARLVYGFLGDRIFSSTLSNLGVVELPPELAERVESMDFVLGTSRTSRASCSLVTVGNTATLTIAKGTLDPSFEEALYALLTEAGLAPEAEESGRYED